MSKLTKSVERPSSTTPTAIALLDSRLALIFERIAALGVNPRMMVAGCGLVCIGLIGWGNFHIKRGLDVDYFYLLVCALVGWLGGARAALASSVLSVCLMFSSMLSGGLSSFLWMTAANLLVRLLAFVSIGWLAAEVGRATRELQQTVERKTASLQQEVKEHKQTAELLSEATEVFRQVTENIADVFWVTDVSKTQVEYISPEFEELWGHSLQELYVSPSVWIEGIHPADRDRVTHSMFTNQVTGHYDEEYRVVRPDGSLRWVHDRAFPVRDGRGAVYRLVGIAEDITERKRNEHFMHAERDVGVALSSTSDPQVALDRLLDVAVQLEGIDCGGVYLADPLSGDLKLQAHRGLSGSFVARISRYKADAAEARVARSGQSLYMQKDQIPRSLEVLWGSEGLRALAVVPIQHQGSVLGMLNLASYRYDEILPRTRIGIELIASQAAGAIARIQAEESLRRSEAQLRTIVNSAPIALIATDAQGTITFEDGQALHAMGARPGEHVHSSAFEVYGDFPTIQENVRRGLAGEELSMMLERDSTVFECRCTPLRGNEGQVNGLIAVALDVTERSRLQREILEISDREQARIGQDIHDGLCQQLIGLAISANSLEQSLRQRPESETAAKICRLLDEAITEARGVCQGLYTIRLSTQGLAPALEELAAGATERHGVHCTCEVDQQGLRCDMATATHLYRIAQEAVNNSIKYSGARNISIRLTGSDEAIKLQVRDDGRWLNRPPARHSGMGMHIMNYRAQLLGGTLSCEGAENGTIASCNIPRELPKASS